MNLWYCIVHTTTSYNNTRIIRIILSTTTTENNNNNMQYGANSNHSTLCIGTPRGRAGNFTDIDTFLHVNPA